MGPPPRRWWLKVVIAVGLPASVIAQPTPTPTPIPIPPPSEFDGAPGRNTVGLTSDGERLWASDPDTRTIYRHIRDDTWEVQLTWNEKRKPGPLAWGDSGLWVVDESREQILRYEFDPDSERLTGPDSIPIPGAAIREVPSISGLAWDGSSLWLSTACGLCSAFFRIDPIEGRVIQVFFPGCEPRGLAYRSNLELWTIAYNGPYKQSFLSRRKISGDPDAVPPSQQFQDFGVGVTPPVDPTVIVFHDGLRVLNRQDGALTRYDPSSVDP